MSVAFDVALDGCSPVSSIDQTEEEKKERAKRRACRLARPHLASDLHFVYSNLGQPHRGCDHPSGRNFSRLLRELGPCAGTLNNSTDAHPHPNVHRRPRPTHVRHRNSAHCGNHLRKTHPKTAAAPPADAYSVADGTILAHIHPRSPGPAILRNSTRCGSSNCHSHRRSVHQLQPTRCAKAA